MWVLNKTKRLFFKLLAIGFAGLAVERLLYLASKYQLEVVFWPVCGLILLGLGRKLMR